MLGITVVSETVIVDAKAVVRVDDDCSDKTDSGMDEGPVIGPTIDVDSPVSMDTGEADSDEDDPIVRKKPLKKIHHLFDDDDDDSQGISVVSIGKVDTNNSNGIPSKKLTVGEALSEVLDAGSDHEEEDKDGSDSGEDVTLSSVMSSQKKKSRIKRGSFLGDDDDDDDSDDDGHGGEGKSKSSRGTKNDVTQDSGNSSQPNKMTFDSDIFDAESDDDNDGRHSKSECEGSGDEGYEESDQERREVSDKLKARLKKGAAKKPKRESKKQVEKENIMELHSETQRLIRESRVNIPYHQPKPKPLSDFLNSAAQKQSAMKALRGPAGFKNISWYEEKEREKEKQRGKERQREKENLLKQSIESRLVEKDVLESVARKLEPLAKKQLENDVPDNSDNTGNSIGERSCRVSAMEEDFDTLPDLVVEVDTNNDNFNAENSVSCDREHRNMVSANSDLQANGSGDKIESDSLCTGADNLAINEQTKAECVSVQDQPSGAIEEVLNTSGIQLFEDPEEGVYASVISAEENTVANTTHQNKPSVLCVNNSETNVSTPIASSVKKCSNTPTLAGLCSLDFESVTPKLSGAPDSFITLEEGGGEQTPTNSGVHKLMSRFLQHSKKKKPPQSKDVNISVVHKEKVSDEKEELKMDTVVYHVEEEKDLLDTFDKSGDKLTALKEQLSAQMKVKRVEARQKRVELYELDNEEGYNEEEEEAEMTDGSDTDDEEEEEDGEYKPGDEIKDDDDARKCNPYVDEEADDEDEEDDVDEDGDADDSDAENSDADDNDAEDGCDEVDGDIELKSALDDDDRDSNSLKLALSDVEDEDGNTNDKDDDVMISSSQKVKKKPQVLRISDDEESKDVPEKADIESHDPVNDPNNVAIETKDDRLERRDIDRISDDGGMTPFTKHLSSVGQPESWSSKKLSKSLSLPIEDSQDLYSNSMPGDAPNESFNGPSQSQSLDFFIEDTQSQMLDDDGFLRMNSTLKKPVRKAASLRNPVYPEDTMDELLGLCSGKFAEGTQKPELMLGDKKTSRSLFSQLNVNPATQKGDMDELLGLCSGQFIEGSQKVGSQKRGIKRRPVADDEDSDAESESSFKFLSDDEDKENNDKDELASEDEENSGDDNDQQSDTALMPAPKFPGFTHDQKKQRKLRREFIEDEAELSGSEYDSDENLDLAEEDDIMEAEAGDNDVQMSEDQLRNQVGRVHLKNLMDDDHREVIKLQEMYLPDGDLHSDGAGRARRFRWSNMDDDTQQDMFGGGSDEEAVEEEGENDIKWRMERHEREKWLEEQRDNEAAEDSSSQFMKFGKLVLKQRNKAAEAVPKEAVDNPKPDIKAKAVPQPKLNFSQKRGSFLSRSKDSLAKIAERTKSGVKTSNTGRNPNNFVFKVVSPESQDKKTTKVNPAPKRSYSLPSGSQPPSAKRPKTDDSSFSQNSIFNHFH